MVIQLIILILFFICYFFAKSKKNRKNPFYKIALFLVELFDAKIKNNKIEETLKMLFPNESIVYKVKEFKIAILNTILFILFMGNLLSILIQFNSNQKNTIINKHFIERNSYGKGERTETVIAQIEGEQKEKKIEVTLSERQFTKEKIDQMFHDCEEEMTREFLGKNQSVDMVNQSVRLVNTIRNGLINVEWEITPFGLIDYSGRIIKKEISNTGELGKITACLKYFDYEYYYTFYIKVYPKESNGEIDLIQGLKNQIMDKEKESLTKSRLELPQTINNQKITWKNQRTYKGFWILLLTIIISIGLYFKKVRDLKDKLKEREQQMLLDYSNIVSKLMLLLGAGMSVSQGWKRIVLDYKRQRQENHIPSRYIYEEMLLTYYEMCDGISEIEAFERFGRRCKVQKYLKLSGVLIQNIRQGTKEINRILQYEAKDAMEERKSIAKKLGEEAGTKLLGPMMILLIVVLVIIAVPAFLTL